MFRWILPLVAAVTAHAQVYEGKTVVVASLVADVTAIVPGRTFRVGLLLDQAPGWHTYWQNPGDAGLPTSIAWSLPDGFAAGPIDWPIPLREAESGGLEAYAYKNHVLLMTTIQAPAGLAPGTPVTLRATAAWLVCEEICIPGSADLTLTLPVEPSATADNADLFAHYTRQLPSMDAPPFPISWSRAGNTLTLTATNLPDGTGLDVFPLPAKGQTVSHPKAGTAVGGSATVTLDAAGELNGILVATNADGRRGWRVSSGASAATVAGATSPVAPPIGLGLALLYGFLGGLILNIMPCVLPVISLKIFGFVKQAGDEPAKIFRHGLAFVGGIFAWFLGLAAIISAIKLSGGEVTWAFQFQNPWFNFGIVCIVFVFALNLFGVFEIVLPGRASMVLDEASSDSGYGGSFLQGVFATLLATPCTAPFLGAALGFAFAQPPGLIFVVFAAVSLGMGAPYLVLSAKPGWLKWLPKPGVWMERVKQFMGFPLLATLLWLLLVLGSQKGHVAVIWTGSVLLSLAVACWIYGAFIGPLDNPRKRLIATRRIHVTLSGAAWFTALFASEQPPSPAASVAGDGAIPWQPFSQATLDELLAAGKPVFVDFTADWCLSCKYNERTAIDTPPVREILKRDGIVPLRADWTNANPEITAALKKFNRVGVPFYVFYPAGRPNQPVILPELITTGILLDAFSSGSRK